MFNDKDFLIDIRKLTIIRVILHPLRLSWLVLPVIDEEAVFVYLVLQGEVEGKVSNAFIVVNLHFGGVLVCLKVFDNIREPDWQAIIPATRRIPTINRSARECWFNTEIWHKHKLIHPWMCRQTEETCLVSVWFERVFSGCFFNFWLPSLLSLLPLRHQGTSIDPQTVIDSKTMLLLHSREIKMTEMQCGCKPCCPVLLSDQRN